MHSAGSINVFLKRAECCGSTLTWINVDKRRKVVHCNPATSHRDRGAGRGAGDNLVSRAHEQPATSVARARYGRWRPAAWKKGHGAAKSSGNGCECLCRTESACRMAATLGRGRCGCPLCRPQAAAAAARCAASCLSDVELLSLLTALAGVGRFGHPPCGGSHTPAFWAEGDFL